jgi:hypothetical protein
MFWPTQAHANARDDLGLRERNGVYLVGVVHLQDRDVSLGRRWGRQHLDRRAGAAVWHDGGEHPRAESDDVGQGLGQNRGHDMPDQGRFELYELPVRIDLQVNDISGQP